MRFKDLFKRAGLIAAHRGNRSQRPENTLSALQESIGKCDFIEIDVQLSSDDIPIIIHDETLERTTNIADIARFKDRYPWRVETFTLDELESLDYGSWFYKEGTFGKVKAESRQLLETRAEPLLTLEQALVFAKEQQVFLNVEIKDLHAYFPDREVVSIIIELIQKLHAEPFVLLSSFRHAYLLLCKVLAPEIPTAALQEGSHPKALFAYLDSLSIDAYHPDEKILDRVMTIRLRQAGYFVGVFTVNESLRQQELFEWGVNAVFTDFPNNKG